MEKQWYFNTVTEQPELGMIFGKPPHGAVQNP